VLRWAGLLFLVFVTAVWNGQPALAQAPDREPPVDLRHLVIFEPDPGQLIYYPGNEHRTLMYFRTKAHPGSGRCEGRSTEVWAVWIADYGADAAAAHHAYVQFLGAWRLLPGVSRETSFEAADEGTIFETDARQETAGATCGKHGRDTLFRIDGKVIFTSEECWNEAPVERPHLAQRLGLLLGAR